MKTLEKMLPFSPLALRTQKLLRFFLSCTSPHVLNSEWEVFSGLFILLHLGTFPFVPDVCDNILDDNILLL